MPNLCLNKRLIPHATGEQEMAQSAVDSRTEPVNIPSSSTLQESPIPSASLNLRLDYIRALAGRGLIDIRKG
jgi:hypothetical protein